MKKILLTGANGMLASDFHTLYSKKYELIMASRNELDITNFCAVQEYLTSTKFDLVLNFAAYTAVDDAEDIGSKTNMDVNALGVYHLAKVSFERNIDFITISSDYVFDGEGTYGYSEKDKRKPLNAYGMAKYVGETLCLNVNKNSIIIRTSWLYGGGKNFKNFVNTMITLGTKMDSLKIINDQIGSPTYGIDLCEAIGKVISNIEKYRGHTLHFSNQTSKNGISWYDFAKEIFKQTNIKVNAIACTSEEFQTKAKRPHYSKLINNSDIQLQDWKKGVSDYLNNLEKGHGN